MGATRMCKGELQTLGVTCVSNDAPQRPLQAAFPAGLSMSRKRLHVLLPFAVVTCQAVRDGWGQQEDKQQKEFLNYRLRDERAGHTWDRSNINTAGRALRASGS